MRMTYLSYRVLCAVFLLCFFSSRFNFYSVKWMRAPECFFNCNFCYCEPWYMTYCKWEVIVSPPVLVYVCVRTKPFEGNGVKFETLSYNCFENRLKFNEKTTATTALVPIRTKLERRDLRQIRFDIEKCSSHLIRYQALDACVCVFFLQLLLLLVESMIDAPMATKCDPGKIISIIHPNPSKSAWNQFLTLEMERPIEINCLFSTKNRKH